MVDGLLVVEAEVEMASVAPPTFTCCRFLSLDLDNQWEHLVAEELDGLLVVVQNAGGSSSPYGPASGTPGGPYAGGLEAIKSMMNMELKILVVVPVVDMIMLVVMVDLVLLL